MHCSSNSGGEFNGIYHYAVISTIYGTVQGTIKFLMNSKERHEVRYQRRKAKRIERKRIIEDKYCVYDKVFTFDNLYQSFKNCCKGVNWKSSTQIYKANGLMNVYKTFKELRDGRYKTRGFIEFDIMERGKPRHIKSVHISERIVQKCLCDYSLTPLIKSYFIYDNGACIKHKGIDFAMNRMDCFLHRYYRKYGYEGYALVFDFSKYFDNIHHQILLNNLKGAIPDERIFGLFKKLVDDFGEIGLGLGSQVSQISALAHPNKLDHYIKEFLKIEFYCRYMDDGVLIHQSKEYLQRCLQDIIAICTELGIKLNTKKTQIVKLSRGIRFLKTRFILMRTGKVIRIPYKKNITTMRRKLKAFKRFLDSGKMTLEYISNCYKSWRGNQIRFNSYWATRRMDGLFHSLFPCTVL